MRSHFNFLKKKTWKNLGKTPIFHIYRLNLYLYRRPLFLLPYSNSFAPGRKTCSLRYFITPPVEITPKTPAKFASLNSSIAFRDLRLGGCLRAPGVLWFTRITGLYPRIYGSSSLYTRTSSVIFLHKTHSVYLHYGTVCRCKLQNVGNTRLSMHVDAGRSTEAKLPHS